jgi:hypothetical protein
MDLTEEIRLILQSNRPEGQELEYKAVLPPARSIGQIISAFANADGGIIILGVNDIQGRMQINGLSEDFNANSVTHKAIDLLMPKPLVSYQYVSYNGLKVYAIKVEKSDPPVLIEGKTYIRNGANIILNDPQRREIVPIGVPLIDELITKIDTFRESATSAKIKFIDHYQSVLNIVSDLGGILYPNSITIPTENQEGKILIRILFSSCADNFETYLADLLYEIYLANPSTLKSNQQVSIKEVLDCSDMQEFVVFWSKKKLSKLQRGSVKGFISDNSQINDLNVFNDAQIEEIEKILQIRHLYAHRNGIVDEKFLQFCNGQFNVNEEHRLTISNFLNHFQYLTETIDRLDKAAIEKYQLSTLN